MPVTLDLRSRFRRVEAKSADEPPVKGQDLIRHQDAHRQVLCSSILNTDIGCIISTGNGFVHSMIRGWEQNQHIQLRPDDIWLSVLVQFAFYLKGKGVDKLREFQQNSILEKQIIYRKDSESAEENDAIIQQILYLFRNQLLDDELRNVILPDFSTSQPSDQCIAALSFLGLGSWGRGNSWGTKGSYASITLQGERQDWVNILTRITCLERFRKTDTTEKEDCCIGTWLRALSGVIELMIASFDRPTDLDVRNFWKLAYHPVQTDDDDLWSPTPTPTTMSGWLTVFCWWSPDGTRRKTYDNAELQEIGHSQAHQPLNEYGGIVLPVMEVHNIPPGVTELRVTLQMPEGETEEASFIAGSSGTRVLDAVDVKVEPFSSWWLLLRDSNN